MDELGRCLDSLKREERGDQDSTLSPEKLVFETVGVVGQVGY